MESSQNGQENEVVPISNKTRLPAEENKTKANGSFGGPSKNVFRRRKKAPSGRDPKLAAITRQLKAFKISEPVKKVIKRDLASITVKLNNLVIGDETSSKYKMKLRSYTRLADKKEKPKVTPKIKTEDSETKPKKKKCIKASELRSHSMILRPRRQ